MRPRDAPEECAQPRPCQLIATSAPFPHGTNPETLLQLTENDSATALVSFDSETPRSRPAADYLLFRSRSLCKPSPRCREMNSDDVTGDPEDVVRQDVC